MTQRHKVFVSYHHELDEYYRNRFEKIFGEIYVSKSVDFGDIDPNLKTETIRQKIRNEFIRDSSVTIVLIGKETWKRKHVDWEIYSSLRDTKYNPRSGLLGLFLPTHPDHNRDKYNPKIIPPRLFDNIKCGFAQVYDWIEDDIKMQDWIHKAFLNKDKINPDLSRQLFKNNRSGLEWQ